MTTSAYNPVTKTFTDHSLLDADDLNAARADILADAAIAAAAAISSAVVPGVAGVSTFNGRGGAVTLNTNDIDQAGGVLKATFATVATTGSYTDLLNKPLFLSLSGGQLSGPLTLPGAPTLTLHATTKGYVDTAIATAIATIPAGSGGTSTGTGSSTQYAAVTPITVNTIITPQQAGSLFLVNTTGVTVTLPSRALVPVGSKFAFTADHLANGGTVVVNTTNADPLFVGIGAASVTTYTLQPGDTWEIVAGSSAWETTEQPLSAVSQRYDQLPPGPGWQDTTVIPVLGGSGMVAETGATLVTYLEGRLNISTSNLVRTVYTTPGAISPADDRAICNLPTDGTMTLANGTQDGHQIIVKRYGPGAVTVVATIDGTAQSIVLPATTSGFDSLTLEWTPTLTPPTYILL